MSDMVEIIEYYEVRTDVICNYYQNYFDNGLIDPIVEQSVAEYLKSFGRIKYTSDIFADIIVRHDHLRFWIEQLPDKEQWKNGYTTGACARKMVELITRYSDLTDAKCFNQNLYYFFPVSFPVAPQTGVVLNEAVAISRTKTPDRFRYFFGFILSKCTSPVDFLDYHFTRTFNNDAVEFRLFITELLTDDESQIKKRGPLLQEYLNQIAARQQVSSSPGFATTLTHREEIIKQEFERMTDRTIEMPTAKEHKQISHKRYLASLTFVPGHETYRDPTKRELEHVLSVFTNEQNIKAAELVKSRLDQIF
jgi:hypothetical protein